MKVELIGKQMIKPALPTPDHLRTVQLTFFDQFFPPIYTTAIFFYNSVDHTISPAIISHKLKKSLSETLARFYPLAGRLEGASINCNDEGATFIEAQANFLLSDFLRHPDNSSLEQLLPPDFIMSTQPLGSLPLLQVKVNFFRCGGMAIAVCVSHKICDAASLVTFVRGWTATTKGCPEAVIPEFTASTILPPADVSFQLPPMNDIYDVSETCETKRFVFSASKIAELKRMVASKTVQEPTRVEAVATLIWKRARKASRANSGTSRLSAMTQGVDLRRWIPSSHLSHNAMGNLLSAILVKEIPENEMETQEIVTMVRKAKDEFNEMIKENLDSNMMATTFGENMANALVHLFSELKPEMDIYPVTGWCKMPFYEADFGWGNPVWVAPGPNTQSKNTIYVLLMDTKDGEGIEAWVCLRKEDMLVFENDEALLAFASKNPTLTI